MRETCTPLASYAIPLHRLPLEDSDVAALTAAIGGGLLTGGEQANQRLAALAEQTLGCLRAFPAPSGTHALELMMRALPLEPGDEVILPSFTFVSAANAVILAGGRPVLADIDPDTLNLDPADAAARVTLRTRAVLTAHYAGIAAGLDALASLAARTGIALLEDAALAQWNRIDAITSARRERFDRYQQAFAPLAAAGDVARPTVPDGCEPAYHIYYLLADTKASRDGLVAWMRERGIEASSHFVPLHLSPYAANVLGTRPGQCPVTERVADRLVRLPLYPALSPADQQTVV